MKNRDLFRRDLTSAHLMNNGQARIETQGTEQEIATLREELSNFVCEGQYADGTIRILESFLSHLSSTSQPAAWVSGFYGSGKSHLLKMLCHLWVNTEFRAQGDTARSLVPSLPDEIAAALKELDTRGRQVGGLHAASGTLPADGTGSVRLAILGILLRSKGLPEAYAQAKFCLYLRNNGFLDRVRKHVEGKGKDFARELNELYVSPVLREALIAVDPHLGDPQVVRDTLKKEFSQPAEISTAEFIRMAREVLTPPGGQLPLTIVVLDEVQLFIGDSSERATLVTEIAETLCKQMDSRVMLVGAGQSALGAETKTFGRLRDRFTISVELSDEDVETVTRRVLLAKRPDKVDALRKSLESFAGEIDRQLKSTGIASTSADRDILIDDYPILPVRRRFWEHVLRAVDPSGASAMLRAQLRIIHDSLRDFADKPLGTVVPADFIFDQLQPGMVQQGVLLRELDERIRKFDAQTPEGKLSRRLCGLIFLIRRLPREGGADIGVRATPDMLADLLVSDLANDGAGLRKEVPRVIQKLVEAAVLLDDHGEYNLQTRESSEWEKDFRNRITRIQASAHEIAQQREALIRDAIQQAVKGVKVLHGLSKVPRPISIHFGEDPPAAGGGEIPVWVRDEWSVGAKVVTEDARKAGMDSPVVFVCVPKKSSEDLEKAIIQAKAAQGVLDSRGVPSTKPGLEARNAMHTRAEQAAQERETLIRELVDAARVYKGGGQELHQLILEEKIRDAAEAANDRLFPQFRQADHKNWPMVISRARGGDESPLEVLGWTAPTPDHAVCKEILRAVGAGKDGRAIRKTFSESPYGWPQDAIDGALIALLASGHLMATQGGAPLDARQLDQNKIAKTEFRTETVTLTAKDKLNLREMFQEAGLPSRLSDNLEEKSVEFLVALGAAVAKAGGEAPLPERPKLPLLDELRALAGNERLGRMLKEKETLRGNAKEVRDKAALADKRLPTWERLTSLLQHGDGIPALAEIQASAQAIREKRLLLDSSDHVAPLAKRAAGALRTALLETHRGLSETHATQMKALEGNSAWKQINADQRRQILASEGISEVPAIRTGSDEELLAEFGRTSLASWKDKTDALPSRFASAAMQAAKLLEPKVQRVHLASGTLRTEAEVKAWVGEQEAKLLGELKNGPIVIA